MTAMYLKVDDEGLGLWLNAFSGDFSRDLCGLLFETELEVLVRKQLRNEGGT